MLTGSQESRSLTSGDDCTDGDTTAQPLGESDDVGYDSGSQQVVSHPGP